MLEFTWVPDYGASGDKKFDVKIVSFGDGYEQRLRNGINTAKDVWAVSFSKRDLAESNAIMAFLVPLQGAESFLWTPPGEVTPRTFRSDLSIIKTPVPGGMYNISTSFFEVFGL